MAGKIFISYRRSETAWAARALFERLWREFPHQVFIDLEGIDLGVEFNVAIEQHLEGCHAMLAVIGPTWLDEIQRRRNDKRDYVRIELARALERRIPVVPVLIDGADMPDEDHLPDALKAITLRNGLKVVPDTFDAHLPRVAAVIRSILKDAGVEPTHTTAKAPAAAPGPSAKTLSEPWMSAEGRDEFGHWAELSVNGVVQRLRWIEPGEFWMGSTEAERKRFGEQGDDDWKKWIQNEAPRHRVKLTRGFWLADTACTQALWQTVAGDNPSSFTGDPNLPVEMVSWNDVTQKFLPALNRQLSGVAAVLPTEAQWAYACRAGTETAYHFGEQIHTDQVNYDGNHPPPGGRKGEYRERTLPVKALPANAWGLHQMHGNVWEICADLADGGVLTVVGQRAWRGGCWGAGAAYARSAHRRIAHLSDRNNYGGFRFSVSPIERPQGLEVSSGGMRL